ncbi:DUF3237 domain-containing protein [Falsiroseomonas oryziterrae]|uniref:DUF3237 domain-containing protein n=1 Tax=Falsiroseomonas oryziterrae TaxID=2911368 RepID=UPI001F4663B6|nr:DUF3237 domain-containing protein [Roseomonas sp. NPKOSM-4]
MPLPLATEFLFRVEMTVEPTVLGPTPLGDRRVGLITGGRFEGPAMRGEVLPGGADWMLTGPDGATRLDVRAVLRADHGQLVGITYTGLRAGPPEVLARLAAGESVDPAEYYMRTAIRFETGAGPLEWLNRVLAVAIGQRPPQGPIYDVHVIR